MNLNEPEHPGCYNRPPMAPGYWAKDGHIIDWPPPGMAPATATQVMKWIPHVMSTKCRSDWHKASAQCDGCQHLREDVEYFERMGL